MDEIITSPIPPSDIYLDKEKYSVHQFLMGVDDVLHQIDSTGDFEIGMQVLRGMSSLSKASGLSLAKLLHGMYVRWPDDKQDDDKQGEFFDKIKGYVNIQRITVERYVHAWEAGLAVPDKYKDMMYSRPTRDWIKLGEAWAGGYVPDDSQWQELLKSQNSSEFVKVIRGIKKSKPRSSSLEIYLERDGTIYGYQNGKRVFGGTLAVRDKDSSVQKLINRIVKGANIIVR